MTQRTHAKTDLDHEQRRYARPWFRRKRRRPRHRYRPDDRTTTRRLPALHD